MMSQRWNDVSFAHFPVDPSVLRPLLPPAVDVDTFEGRAWVSMVGFEMDELRLTGLPRVPTTSRFPEFNVRTYVTGSAGPGVWFFSLDVPHWLPALTARVAFALPYCRARVDSYRTESIQAWSIERTWPDRVRGSLAMSVGDPIEAVSDLDDFLTARWRLYSRFGRGRRVLTAPVTHEPWPLHRAELLEIDTAVATSVVGPLSDAPLLHHAPSVSVQVGRPRWA